MKVKVTVAVITVLKMTLSTFCGVKQLQASLQANVPMSAVPSAVKAGSPTIIPTWNIVARMKQLIGSETSAIKTGEIKRIKTCA